MCIKIVNLALFLLKRLIGDLGLRKSLGKTESHHYAQTTTYCIICFHMLGDLTVMVSLQHYQADGFIDRVEVSVNGF